jgi:hypothetical protein
VLGKDVTFYARPPKHEANNIQNTNEPLLHFGSISCRHRIWTGGGPTGVPAGGPNGIPAGGPI